MGKTCINRLNSVVPGPWQPKQKKSISWKCIILAVLLILVVLGVGVFLYVQGSRRDESAYSYQYARLVDGAENMSFRPFEQAYYDRVFVTLSQEEHRDDGSGTAQATISTPNMREVLADVFAAMGQRDGLDDEQYAERYQSAFVDALAKHPDNISTVVPVDLRNDNGQWKIVPNDEYNAAVTGDLANIYQEYYSKAVDDYVRQHP